LNPAFSQSVNFYRHPEKLSFVGKVARLFRKNG
jgi:hypothetical protein